jgi:ABC-type sugar transport system substrate-binding protein
MNLWKTLPALLGTVAVLAVGCNSGQEKGEVAGQGGEAAKPGEKVMIGFSQIGADNPWRTAETASIREEGDKLGYDLKFADGQEEQENQVAAIKTFINQGVKVIILAPKTEDGWEDVLMKAKDANIPVVLVDRGVNVTDDSLYATLICSDFVEEGRMAAKKLIEEVDKRIPKTVSRTRVIYELQGTTGAAPANDRRKGFKEIIDANPAFKIVESQTGDFKRAKGKEVMEGLLKKGIPDAVYAHNDEMALGAIQAIEAIGKRPGQDIVVVSIDGMGEALQALIAGKMNATIECNPLLGPMAFESVAKLLKGEPVGKKQIIKDSIFDQERAKKEFKSRKY